MTPQPRDTNIAHSVASPTAEPVTLFTPPAKTGAIITAPTPANDTGAVHGPTILEKRRRRRARLAAR